MQTSARYGVSYPSADRLDAPDIPTHLANIIAGLEQSAMFGQGPIASRPVSTVGTPGKQGRIYASTDESPQRLYYDYGTGWFQVGALAAGAVGSTELADNSVTAAKIATGAVGTDEIADGSITNPDYQDNSINAAKLASALKPSQGAGAATEALRALGTAAGLAAPGTHGTQHALAGADPLPTNSVGAAQIQDGTVGSAEIADGSIVDGDVSATAAIKSTKLTSEHWLFGYPAAQNQFSVSPANWQGFVFAQGTDGVDAKPSYAGWSIGTFLSVTIPADGHYLAVVSCGWDNGPWIRVRNDGAGGGAIAEYRGARAAGSGMATGVFKCKAGDVIHWEMFSAASNISIAIDTNCAFLAIKKLLS